jgi:hypothetical protein
MSQYSPLEVVLDDDGAVTFGWLGEAVLYAHLSGGLSETLGQLFVARLQSLVDRADSLSYFSDASELQHYDLRARNELVSFFVANRDKFDGLVMLTWSEGASAASQAVAAAIGDRVDILTDANRFDARLLQIAPSAARLIDARSSTPKVMEPSRHVSGVQVVRSGSRRVSG